MTKHLKQQRRSQSFTNEVPQGQKLPKISRLKLLNFALLATHVLTFGG